MEFHVGTSGWVYPHWQGRFYPDDLRKADWLDFYAKYLKSVELNRSFYRLPSPENFATWRNATPEDFRFVVKASRYITHMKKLKDPDKTLPQLLEAIEGLKDKLGPLLFQLPPRWRVNPARLKEFLEALPQGLQAVFEFRDRSWHSDEVLGVLSDFNAAFCVYDLGGFITPLAVTADFTYLRLHGPVDTYRGCYDSDVLEGWAEWLRDQPVDKAYVYFNNDEAAYAVRNARALREILE